MKKTLEEKILDIFAKEDARNSYSLWAMADLLYDNCMQKSLPGNGGRIAAIRKAAEKSDKLTYFVMHPDRQYVALNN